MVSLTLLICVSVSNAQHQIAKHYSIEDGLPSNHIYYILQDKKGFIWLATNNGVSRFDGKTFRNFSSTDGLPDNDIIDIGEDNVGRIWLSCFNGAICFIKDNRLYTVGNDSLLKLIGGADNYIRFINFGHKFIVPSASTRAGYEINETGNFRPIHFKNSDCFTLGNYLISYNSNLTYKICLFNSRYRCVDSLLISKDHPLFNRVLSANAIDANQFVITTTLGKAHKYYIRNDKILFQDSFKMLFPITRLYNFQGEVWGTQTGNQIFPINSSFVIDTTKGIRLDKTSVNRFFIDREHNIWACSPGSGLYLIPNNGFNYYSTQNILLDNNIMAMSNYGDEIYLGYSNSTIQNLQNHTLYEGPNEMVPTRKKITCMLANKHFIVAGRHNRLMIVDKQKRWNYLLNIQNIKCLHQWQYNSFLLSTHSSCLGITYPDQITDTIFHGRSTAICPRKDGRILIGTLHGLYVAQKNNTQQWVIDTTALTHPSLRKLNISCIEEIEDITVIGTVEKGLLLAKGNEVEQLKLEADGQNINCRKIIIDRLKNIWLASYSGLYKVSIGANIHDYSVQKIGKFNGLLSNFVSDLLIIGDSVYVSSSEGLTVFSKSKWDSNRQQPIVWINEILVNNRLYPIDTYRLTLAHDSNNIELSFSGIDFKSMGNIQFKYRLLGLNENWQNTLQNSIRYESLNPGAYTFEIMAMNSCGIWSKSITKVTFEISPPWWKSSFFLIVAFAIMLILFIWILRTIIIHKHRKELKTLLQKKQITDLELRAIKAQINPHFLFNALNSIQCFINDSKNELADEYLSRLADLLRETLEFSSKTEVPITDEVNFLKNYLSLEKLRFDEYFSYSIECTPKPEIGEILIPPMVVQPHIENALRHGLKQKQGQIKRLQIRFRLDKKHLICEIEDNGIGRKTAMELKSQTNKNYSSKGVQLSDSKLKMYAQLTGRLGVTEIIDLYESDQSKPCGTLVRISISI